jgi:rRNA maturation protein Nop10
MALINCPECNKEISDKAVACIHCGYPLDKITKTCEQDIKYKKENQMSLKESIDSIKCPKCGSTQIQAVPRRWSLATGFLTNKVDRVCLNCKNKF